MASCTDLIKFGVDALEDVVERDEEKHPRARGHHGPLGSVGALCARGHKEALKPLAARFFYKFVTSNRN